MDRSQAAEIKKHLRDAARAFDRAAGAIAKLGEAEGKKYEKMLFDVYHAIRFGLLPTLYAEHPDLEPPPKRPHISSKLRWEEVSLPPSTTEADIDAVIFELLKPRLQKMAKVVGEAFIRLEALSIPVSHEIIAARIIALAEAGRIEGAGDLRKWMHSEVRLLP